MTSFARGSCKRASNKSPSFHGNRPPKASWTSTPTSPPAVGELLQLSELRSLRRFLEFEIRNRSDARAGCVDASGVCPSANNQHLANYADRLRARPDVQSDCLFR